MNSPPGTQRALESAPETAPVATTIVLFAVVAGLVLFAALN